MRGRNQTLCNLDTPQNLIFFLGFQKQHKTWCSVLSEPVEGSTHFFKGTAWEQRELGNTDPRVFVYLLAFFFFFSKILTLQTSSLVNPFFCYHHFLDFYSRLQTEYPHGVKGRVVMESRPWGCRRAEPIPLLHAFPPSCSTFLVLHLLPFKTQIMDIGFSIQNRSAGFHDEQTSYPNVCLCMSWKVSWQKPKVHSFPEQTSSSESHFSALSLERANHSSLEEAGRPESAWCKPLGPSVSYWMRLSRNGWGVMKLSRTLRIGNKRPPQMSLVFLLRYLLQSTQSFLRRLEVLP